MRYLTVKQATELVPYDPHWRDRAACAGDWFLMESPAFEAEAKRLCIGCPVFWQCRAEGDRFESISPAYYLNPVVLAGETGLERATRRRWKRQRRKSRAREAHGWDTNAQKEERND